MFWGIPDLDFFVVVFFDKSWGRVFWRCWLYLFTGGQVRVPAKHPKLTATPTPPQGPPPVSGQLVFFLLAF